MIMAAMTVRLSTLLIWAAVAASAVYWGLQLFTRPTPVPAGAVVAAAAPPAVGNLGRLLGTPPPMPVQPEAPVPVADNRFRLLGVVAPRGGVAGGLALISVDGKPPRAWAVGREVEPGLRLLAVNHRQAELGAARGAPTLRLVLPPMAEAQRGRLGEPALPVGAGSPPGFPGGAAAFNRAAAGLPPPGPGGSPVPLVMPRMPGIAPQPVNLPGMPIQDTEAPEPDAPPQGDGGAARTR